MLDDEHGKGRDEKRVSDFEEKWSRRLAILVGTVGLLVVGSLLVVGFASQSQEPASGPLVPCRTLVDRCFVSLMAGAYTYPALNPWLISEAQKEQWRKEFERGPLYAEMFHDVLRWLEEARHLKLVHDDPDEQQEVAGFVASRFLEITDAASIANLEKTAKGRFLLEMCGPEKISEDRTAIVLSYGNILTHYDVFIGLDMSHVRHVHRKSESVKPRRPLGLESPESEPERDQKERECSLKGSTESGTGTRRSRSPRATARVARKTSGSRSTMFDGRTLMSLAPNTLDQPGTSRSQGPRRPLSWTA